MAANRHVASARGAVVRWNPPAAKLAATAPGQQRRWPCAPR